MTAPGPQAVTAAGQRLDRHHPADQNGPLSSCSKCYFMVQYDGVGLAHLPTESSLVEVERLLSFHDWPDDDERLVHRAIRDAADRNGYPVTVDQVVEAIWPGYAQQVKAAGLHIEPLTPMVSHVVRADGRWGRLEVEEVPTGHHLVYGVVLDASSSEPTPE